MPITQKIPNIIIGKKIPTMIIIIVKLRLVSLKLMLDLNELILELLL
jgi:hypothetical protein